MPTSEAINSGHDPDTTAPAPADAVVAEEQAAPPAGRGGRRSASWLVGGVLVLLGVGLVLVGTMTFAQPVVARVVLALAGIIGIYTGLARWCAAVFGAGFDLTFWLCVGWLVLIIAAAVSAPLLPLAEHVELSETLTEPAYATPNLFSEHPLGTNNFGLDLLARVIYGARASLVVALAAVVIGMVVGGAIGIVAGYFQRGVDTVVGVLTNSLLSVPPLILLIALASVLSPNLRNIALALSILAIPSMIRVARANTLAFTQREFVLAARTMGASRLRVMTRELLPNVLLPVASLGMVIISVLIVAEASLSFLGLGIQPPQPSWGNMIAEGQGGVLEDHPHIVIVPGIALFLTVFSFNLVGEKARKRWDPRQANL